MLKNKKVLITCGPTWVPIDSMRVISNQSTGALGQAMAEDFARADTNDFETNVRLAFSQLVYLF